MKSPNDYRGAAIALSRALLLCTSLTIPTLAGSLPALADAKDVQVFRKDYNYCDAVILAKFWGIDPYQAKETGGQKIRNNLGRELKAAMRNARAQSSCAFQDTGMVYEDAEKLAGYWGINVGQSKDKIAQLYSRGQARDVRQALRRAGG
jgi:hypothetical protein